jgi:hypothetical protein
MPSKVEQVDGVMGLDGKKGVVLASTEGGLSFVAPGKDSYLLLDTKNLAVLKAGDNSVAIYDDTVTGGMIDIQANKDGAVNLAVQDGATQNTALTITNGKAHLGVFKVGTFDRLHVESGKSVIESAAGVANGVAKDLGMVEVTPTKVTIKCLESIMEVDVNGFSWQNATKSFKMVLQTSKFSVEDISGMNKFEIDLTKQTVSMTGLTLDLESTIKAQIKTLENQINLDIAQVKIDALAAIQNNVDAIKKDQAAFTQLTTKAIADLKSGLNMANPGCWVARAVFGETDIRWRLFRHWLFGDRFHPEQATWLQRSYLRHGPWVAELVRRCPPLRWALYLCMSHCIRGLHAVPHGAFGRASVSPPLSLSHNL